MIPSTNHVREVAAAMATQSFVLWTETTSRSTKRAFEQVWTNGTRRIHVRFNQRGYCTSYGSEYGYAETHGEGHSGRGRFRSPWRPAFTPRNCVDLLVQNLAEGRA